VTDHIRDQVLARAKRLRLSAYEIARRTRGLVSERHVSYFLAGRKSMGSAKLQHVMRVLGLKITET
jgi:hypothetical protein